MINICFENAMNTFKMMILCSCLQMGFTADIVISAPRYVRVNQSFELKCSSFDVPLITKAEFLIDDTTFTYISGHGKVCRNSLRNNILCNINTCHCSEDGRTYALYYKAEQFINQKNITCKMKVADDQISVSNTVTIDVVVEYPKLILNDKSHCNHTHNVTLVCRIHDDVKVFRFNPWKHVFNDVVIRSLDGFVDNRLGYLQISHCGYQDAGKYMCSIWNSFSDGIYLTNKTTKLFVADLPVILNTTTHPMKTGLIFAVYFYSASGVLSVKWHNSSEVIHNSTKWRQDTKKTTVNITIYGQLVETKGFVSRLIFNKTSHSQREYRVCVANNYGKACKDIRNADDDDEEIVEGVNMLWVMMGVIVMILFTGLIILRAAIRSNSVKYEVPLPRANTGPLEDINQYRTINQPELEPRPNGDLPGVSYQEDIVDNEILNRYLEVIDDADITNKHRDHYEMVD